MTRDEAIQKAIDDAMDFFDVEKCVRVMKMLNWKWLDSTEPPDRHEFRRALRDALKSAARDGGFMSGGFHFTFHDSVDEETGEPFVVFRGGFYVDDVTVLDGVAYAKDESSAASELPGGEPL